MPDDTAAPVPVWSVKFFRDLRSLTPTRLAYISRSSEAEVAQRAPNAWQMKKPPASRFAAYSSTRRSSQTARSIGSIKRPVSRHARDALTKS